MSGLRQALGAALWHLSDLVRADERSRSFRAKAYRRAVWSLDDLGPDLAEPPETMLSVPGIGPGVLKLIEEFRSSGRIAQLERLEGQYPHDVARLRRLPRMTPALLRSLKGELGVEVTADLIAAVESGGVTTLRGVGSPTAERWARILELAPSPEAVPAYQAAVLADSLRRHLFRHLGAETQIAGQLRRTDEWVDLIELIAEVGDFETAMSFLEETAVARLEGHTDRPGVSLRTHEGMSAHVHLAAPGRSGALLLEKTGPPGHTEPLLADIHDDTLTEVAIYARNGKMWIPPAARELGPDTAEEVVRMGQIRGDLHLHTDWSPDGRMGLVDVLSGAVDRGYEYVLITDHTSGLRFGGLDGQALSRQREDIETMRDRFPGLAVMHGAELNIARDGSLDIDEDGLSLLDMAVAGLHSNFDLDRAEQTDRVLRAMQHPVVRVLAHPTGRRIGIRPPVELDMEAVIVAASKNQVALEVNGHQDRLDLSAPLAAEAAAGGAMLVANSDAHRLGEMGNIANSVATMQKAGVGPGLVINTMPLDRLQAWVSRSGIVFG
ncbi:MAG: hypothetical protein ACRDWS_16425 [Acidimicrobiia bacterium]